MNKYINGLVTGISLLGLTACSSGAEKPNVFPEPFCYEPVGYGQITPDLLSSLERLYPQDKFYMDSGGNICSASGKTFVCATDYPNLGEQELRILAGNDVVIVADPKGSLYCIVETEKDTLPTKTDNIQN